MIDLLGNVLGAGEASLLTADAALMDVGLESLRAIELRDQLEDAMATPLPPSLVFDYPTARAIASFLSGLQSDGTGGAAGHGPPRMAEAVAAPPPRHAIAAAAGAWGSAAYMHGLIVRAPARVCGMAALGRLVQSGADAVSTVPSARWAAPSRPDHDDGRLRRGGFLGGIDLFDAARFGIAAAEARSMDPQQRMLLEDAYASLHSSGWRRGDAGGAECGTFLGIQALDHLHATLAAPATGHHRAAADAAPSGSAYAATGGSHAIACGRLAYALHLQGPAMAVDTACSAALVAGHSARRALQLQECASSVIACVNVMLVPAVHALFANAGMTSPTGRCHTFDRGADGYARAEAVAAATLRSDPGDAARFVWAGSAVRQDGARASLTAPNGIAQGRVVSASLSDAAWSASALTCHEAHGTGTSLGDPIEMGAIGATLLALRTSAAAAAAATHSPAVAGALAVGTAKANVGHGEPAAGCVGLFSLLAALWRRASSPNAQLRVMNPLVRAALQSHGGAERCALGTATGMVAPLISGGGGSGGVGGDGGERARQGGVASFGYSGTIAHVSIGGHAQPMMTIGTSTAAAVAAAAPARRIAYRRRRFRLAAATDVATTTPTPPEMSSPSLPGGAPGGAEPPTPLPTFVVSWAREPAVAVAAVPPPAPALSFLLLQEPSHEAWGAPFNGETHASPLTGPPSLFVVVGRSGRDGQPALAAADLLLEAVQWSASVEPSPQVWLLSVGAMPYASTLSQTHPLSPRRRMVAAGALRRRRRSSTRRCAASSPTSLTVQLQ